MKHSIDVIIPSYRLNEEFLNPIFNLNHPENFSVNFFLIADNPDIKISESLKHCIDLNKVNLIVNKENLGFSKTRNVGIEAGVSDWILFLDDDIIPDKDLLINYGNAIINNPTSLGFVGVTNFPKPTNSVTRALVLNGLISAFKYALNKSELTWAPTANMAFNRLLLGNRRFLESLKNGGEDIELLARNSLENNKKYSSLSNAVAIHPWWDFGKMQTKRMFRYGMATGDIMNTAHIKDYTYRDFTNTSETSLILIISVFLLMPFVTITYLITCIFIGIISEVLTNILNQLCFLVVSQSHCLCKCFGIKMYMKQVLYGLV